MRCGKCEEICPTGAITIGKQGRHINRAKCNLCLKCAEVCPTGAIAITGKYMSDKEKKKREIKKEARESPKPKENKPAPPGPKKKAK